MIYYFPDGINNEQMRFTKAMSHEGIAIGTAARFIEFFDILGIRPNDVSVWLQQEDSDTAQYFLGNPGIAPSNDEDSPVDVTFILTIGDLDFITCALDEHIINILNAGMVLYGEYIFGATFQ